MAKRLNGTILLPETFSYNDTVGFTLASGCKAAGTYQNGQSVDATAGGICHLVQPLLGCHSRPIWRLWAPSQFNGGYMPVIGTDAAVWSDQLDASRITPITPSRLSPIWTKPQAPCDHHGTDTTGIHGEPYHVVISTVPWKNTYQPKDSIPVGTS